MRGTSSDARERQRPSRPPPLQHTSMAMSIPTKRYCKTISYPQRGIGIYPQRDIRHKNGACQYPQRDIDFLFHIHLEIYAQFKPFVNTHKEIFTFYFISTKRYINLFLISPKRYTIYFDPATILHSSECLYKRVYVDLGASNLEYREQVGIRIFDPHNSSPKALSPF